MSKRKVFRTVRVLRRSAPLLAAGLGLLFVSWFSWS